MTSRGGSLAGSRVADRLSLLHLGEGAITLEKATAGVPAAKAAGGGPVCNAAPFIPAVLDPRRFLSWFEISSHRDSCESFLSTAQDF